MSKSIFAHVFVRSGSIYMIKPIPKWSSAHLTNTSHQRKCIFFDICPF